jgi:hypothetical protein
MRKNNLIVKGLSAFVFMFLLVFASCDNPSSGTVVDDGDTQVTEVDLSTLSSAITTADNLKINTAYTNLIAAQVVFQAAIIQDIPSPWDTSVLDAAIEAANSLVNSTGVGGFPGQISLDDANIYRAAIGVAQGVSDSAASQAEVDAAVGVLAAATIAFNVAKVPEIDQSAPVITILGNYSVAVVVGTTYDDEGATASDLEEGDMTSSIVTVGDVIDTSEEGTYYVTYNVTDSSGKIALEKIRTVVVAPPMSVPATPAPIPTEAELDSAVVIYSDTALPAGAVQASIVDFTILEGTIEQSVITVDSNDMWKFACSPVANRISLNLSPTDLTGKTMVHFDVYSTGNAAQSAGPDGVTPNTFKVEIQSDDSSKNTYQITDSTPDEWVNVSMLISDFNFAGTGNADLSSITAITFNEYLGTGTQVPSGFYIDNVYFY